MAIICGCNGLQMKDSLPSQFSLPQRFASVSTSLSPGATLAAQSNQAAHYSCHCQYQSASSQSTRADRVCQTGRIAVRRTRQHKQIHIGKLWPLTRFYTCWSFHNASGSVLMLLGEAKFGRAWMHYRSGWLSCEHAPASGISRDCQLSNPPKLGYQFFLNLSSHST